MHFKYKHRPILNNMFDIEIHASTLGSRYPYKVGLGIRTRGLAYRASTVSSTDTEAVSVSVQEGVSVSVLYW